MRQLRETRQIERAIVNRPRMRRERDRSLCLLSSNSSNRKHQQEDSPEVQLGDQAVVRDMVKLDRD